MTSTIIVGPDSLIAKGDFTLNTSFQEINGKMERKTTSKIVDTPNNIKNVLETATWASFLLLRPFAFDTALRRPFPKPKSAKPIRAMTEEMAIHNP